jgi:hypothetical protein
MITGHKMMYEKVKQNLHRENLGILSYKTFYERKLRS